MAGDGGWKAMEGWLLSLVRSSRLVAAAVVVVAVSLLRRCSAFCSPLAHPHRSIVLDGFRRPAIGFRCASQLLRPRG